jgi:hypothetical protein
LRSFSRNAQSVATGKLVAFETLGDATVATRVFAKYSCFTYEEAPRHTPSAAPSWRGGA